MSTALARAFLVLTLVGFAACGSHGGGAKNDAGGDATAGTTGAAGVAGTTGTAGAAAGTSGGAGSAAAGTTGVAGTTGAAGTTGQAGTTGVAGAGGSAAGTTGAGGLDGGVLTSGTGGGVFVMCDDHADFNGRGLCSPTGKFGAVVATQTASAAGTQTTLTAAFSATGKPATDPGCTAEAAGTACTAVTCPRGAPKNAAGPEAGDVTAKSNGGSIVTKPDATGAYDVAGLSSALWSQTKAALTFSAAGGAVPAFSETFCGPPPATITKPTAAPGAGLTIDRSNDLAVTWTGGAVGDVEVVLRDDSGAASSLEVRCFFTGSAGQGTIPKAALAKLAAGTHDVASYVWVRKIALPPGGTCVELTGVATNAAAGGAPWRGSATFQ